MKGYQVVLKFFGHLKLLTAIAHHIVAPHQKILKYSFTKTTLFIVVTKKWFSEFPFLLNIVDHRIVLR